MTATARDAPPEPLSCGEWVGPVDLGKVVRILAAAISLAEALTEGPPDELALRRLDRELSALLVQAGSALPDDLLAELGRLVAPLQHRDRTPDEARIMLGLLIGWLMGVVRSAPVA